MKLNALPLIVFLASITSVNIAPASPIQGSCPDAAYYSVDKTFVLQFTNDLYQFGEVLPGGGGTIAGRELVHYALSDCGNDQFRCLKSVWGMYVLPKVLKPSISSFRYKNADFWVLNCRKGTASTCESAVLVSDCRVIAGGDCASGNGDAIPVYRRLFYVFIQRLGITAMNIPDMQKSPLGPYSIADAKRKLKYYLAGDCGILRSR